MSNKYDKPYKVIANLRSTRTFYMLWSLQGQTNPQVRLPTLKAARQAAFHMALKHPGQKFYIVQSLFQYHTVPKIVERLW